METLLLIYHIVIAFLSCCIVMASSIDFRKELRNSPKFKKMSKFEKTEIRDCIIIITVFCLITIFQILTIMNEAKTWK